MKTYSVRLLPFSSFQALPSSDTLFGAICWGIKRLYGEEKLLETLKEFKSGKPGFILSSSFPLLQDKHCRFICFFPKPLNAGLSADYIDEIAQSTAEKNLKKAMKEIITKYKKFKKAEYLSESLFCNAINGMTEKEFFEDYVFGKIKSIGSMLLQDSEYMPDSMSYKSSTVQRNSIDRFTMSTGEEGQTFYQQEIYASNIFNLHFIIMTDTLSFLLPVLKYLEDNGIGGNRSTGKGRFQIEIMGEKTLPSISNTKAFVSLSRYIPKTDEIEWEGNRNLYEVFPYRSKVESDGEFNGEDIWKSRVMYIKEGSCLEAKDKKEFYGWTPVVKKIGGNNIYQNGLTLPVFGNFGGVV